MSGKAFQTKYLKYKYRVKCWERKFLENFKRIPSKHDIKDASAEVRDAYRKYYHMKTAILEDKLNDVLSDDDDDFLMLPSISQCESFDNSSLNMTASMSELLTKDIQPELMPSNSFSNLGEINKADIPLSTLPSVLLEGGGMEFENTSSDINASKWGAHLNKKKPAVEVVVEKDTAPKPSAGGLKLAEKLKGVQSFTIRNPRKPLKKLGEANQNLSSAPRQGYQPSLPDLESILMQKSLKGVEPIAQPENTQQLASASSKLVNSVDPGWLQRCSSVNSLDKSESLRSNLTGSSSTKFGLSNVNLSAVESGSLSSVCNNSTSFGMSSLNITSSLGSIAMSNSNMSIASYSENTYDKTVHTDDEEIDNSEDESDRYHIIKRRRVEDVKIMNKILHKTMKQLEKSPVKHIAEAKVKQTEKKVAEIPPTEKIETQAKNLKPKSKKEPKTSKKVTETGNKTAAINLPHQDDRPKRIARRSVATKKPQYSEETSNDFDGDDSDADPDFNIKSADSKKSLNAFNKLPNISEPEDDEEEEEVDKKVKKIANKKEKPKRVVKKKTTVTKAPKTSLVTKLRKQASKLIHPRKSKKTATPAEDVPENVEPTDNEYVLEFGIDSINNAPRINMAEFQANTEAFENYVYSAKGDGVPTKAVSKPSTATVEPQGKIQKPLKKNLNENFVRINMKKKVFVRGHKSVNFSRYKKSLWRKKKESALSGPDMDMGGCDGGVLTCHLCGHVGHFARNCKVKGEELLPLSAAEADSAFPTLEEAEEMAQARVLQVHASRPENLPAARNTKLQQSVQSPAPSRIVEDCGTDADADIDADDDDDDDDLCVAMATELEQADEAEVKPMKKTFIGHSIPEDFIKQSGILEFTVGNKDRIDPIYNLNADGTTPEVTKEVRDALTMFGHLEFRKGQDRAIMRILSGQSTLVTLSTGSGKSLCYQLPAYIYAQKKKCVTLVISPLVSLMEDQVVGVPDFLNAQCLHTNQTPKQRENIMASITAGNLDILLVSPEAVVAGEKSSGFGALLKQLPPIAFACIDEAHCVSQWSHNFRPSYLMLCRVLKEKLGVDTILGLTATATLPTRVSIVRHLNVPDGLEGIISDTPLPDNLLLTVSKDVNRDLALIELLRGERFASCQSIIIYCTRRDECERIAAFIRTCLQDNKPQVAEDDKAKRKRKRVNWNAEPYHAGLAASRRKSIQNAFMSGAIRIVIATIAFGMGINKADIRAIIHYNMPKNFESYVQEVGRAGRDGKVAHCHLFLDSKSNDKSELRRHIYANSIDRHVIRKLLQKIFIRCACEDNFKDEKFTKEHQENIEALKDISWSEDMMDSSTGERTETKEISTEPSSAVSRKRVCPGHEVCFSIESTVQLLDIPEENISTLLCYLELHADRYIQVLSRAYTSCKVMSYGGARQLKLAAQTCPPLAMAIALDLKRGVTHNESTLIEFPVIDVAAAIGWDSGVVKYQLKNLEWTTVNGFRKRSTISVIFSDLGFRVRAPGDLNDDELDETLDHLHSRVSNQEKTQLIQLQCVFDALSSVAFKSYVSCSATDCPTGPSEKLKNIIRDYFQNDSPKDLELNEEIDLKMDPQIIADIRTMISRYPENNFTGRSLARIFHGVQSPNFPAVIWGRCKFWRAHTKIDFNHIVALANYEIVSMRK